MTLGLVEKTLDFKALFGGHPPIIMTVTLAADATARSKGTVLGKVTGGNYAPYSDTANDGTESAKVILAEDVDAHASATVDALVCVHGDVLESGLTGIDANGKADLYAVGIFVK
jgi:hypothetical protein